MPRRRVPFSTAVKAALAAGTLEGPFSLWTYPAAFVGACWWWAVGLPELPEGAAVDPDPGDDFRRMSDERFGDRQMVMPERRPASLTLACVLIVVSLGGFVLLVAALWWLLASAAGGV